MAKKKTTEKKEKKPVKKDENEDVSALVKDFTSAWDYTKNQYHSLWEDAYKLYSNKRIKYGYKGTSDAFVPETHTIIESLVANIAGAKPKFSFLPTNEEQEQDTKVLNSLADYYWEANKMNIKSQVWVRDMLLYGTGILHMSWNGTIPEVKNIPLRDFFVDPNATELTTESAMFAGYRYLGNLEQMKREEVFDAETGKMKLKYKSLDSIGEVNQKWDDLDKAVKEMYDGSTFGDTANKRQVEVLRFYYPNDDRLVEVANRVKIIYDGKIPFARKAKTVTREVNIDGIPTKQKQEQPEIKPFYPFAVLRNYIDGSLFYGKGEVEVIMDRQEALNDTENQDNDNTSYANNVMWQIDPQFADMAPEIESIPGAVYPLPKGALSPIERPNLTADLDNKKITIKDEMRRATAADEIIQGVSSEKGRITATEVNTQLNQANQRFSTKINNLESEGYAQLADIEFRIVQVFVTGEMTVRIVGDEGVTYDEFSPMRFIGEYEPHVKLDRTIKAKELEEGQKLNQMYQVLLGNPVTDPREVTKFILKKLGADEDDIKKMMQKPQLGEVGGQIPNAALEGVLGEGNATR